MTVDIILDDIGRVKEVGLLVRACALGQASASILASHVIGKTPHDLSIARDRLTDWLAGTGEPPDWPGMRVMEPALDYKARHPSIRLAFEAAAEAAHTASDLQRAA